MRPQCFWQNFVPTPRVFIDLPLDQLDKALIGHLGLSICLGIVWRWSDQLDPHVSGELPELLGYEDRSSISRDGLRNSNPLNNMLFDKIDNILQCHWLHRDGLHPFGEIVRDGQNVLMTLAGWIHYWCLYHLYLSKPPTCLTSLIIFEAIFKHGGPVIPRSPNQPLHLMSQLMRSTGSFMNLV
jgi:hypothetical protein